MIIKAITFNNFKNFKGNHSFDFDKLTLVQGDNGVGKTTLILDSILFAIYGYNSQALSELTTKGTKSCSVEIEIEHLGKEYNIKREFPTKVTISENKEKLKFVNSREAQNFLNKLFKNVDYFKKFRCIDTNAGINILEEGKTSLKKTLLSFNEELFNNIRNNLLSKKRDREVYNKDKAVIYKHYPSEKRLQVLIANKQELYNQIRELNNTERELRNDLQEMSQQQGKYGNSKEYFKKQRDKLLRYTVCPFCRQNISESHKKTLLTEIGQKIKKFNSSLGILINQITDQKDAIYSVKDIIDNLHSKQEELNKLKMKLETRIKQKNYKWTNRDIEIMKKAIGELDKFYAFYITEWVKNLEPIINSVIEKTDFKVRFVLDEKGEFDIRLYQDEIKYKYKNLSNGQKLILSIAFKLALLLQHNEEGVIIADEGFSSLDKTNLQHILNLFQNLPFQLLCVVHRFTIDENNEIKVINLNKGNL